MLLHPPALPNSRSGHRCDGGRLLVDLGRSVDLEALRPLARRNRCRHRSRSRSARAHGLPRPGGLADGRVGRHGVGIACATFLLVRERVNPSTCVVRETDDVRARAPRAAAARARSGAVLRHASHVLASWPAWRRRLAFARGRRAQNWRASPNGCPRGRCAPTVACKCATDSNHRK